MRPCLTLGTRDDNWMRAGFTRQGPPLHRGPLQDGPVVYGGQMHPEVISDRPRHSLVVGGEARMDSGWTVTGNPSGQECGQPKVTVLSHGQLTGRAVHPIA